MHIACSYSDLLHASVLLEILLEESCRGHVDTHSGEDDGEGVLGLVDGGLVGDQSGLATDLCGDLIVRQTCCGEEGNLLAAGNRHVDIDGGNSGLDHLLRVGALARVDRLALDVQVVLGEDGEVLLVLWGGRKGGERKEAREIGRTRLSNEENERASRGTCGAARPGGRAPPRTLRCHPAQRTDQGLSGTIERSSKHLLADGHLEHITAELAASVRVVNAGRALEDLRQRRMEQGEMQTASAPALPAGINHHHPSRPASAHARVHVLLSILTCTMACFPWISST